MALDMNTLLTELESATTTDETQMINDQIRGLSESKRVKDSSLRSIQTLSNIPAGVISETERANILSELMADIL